ncbi:hypothetical protein K438DRAFT_1583844, partial [Mycena galopus ATCC 62051]
YSLFGPLPANLFCGEMDVPMDYTKPFDAITNNITIGFAMNRPTEPAQGLILHHAGGPGENAAAQAWANAFNLSYAFVGLEDFDFLAINCRGFQFSNPLNITSGVLTLSDFCSPSTQDEFDQYQAAMTNFYNAATRDTTPPGIMEHLGAVELIQDWDSVRAALGYDKVSFGGVSYGTFVGLAYATHYPERVDRFVLDAAIPHGMPYQDMVASQVAAANRLVQRSDAFCLTDPTCPFYGQGNGSVVKSPIPAPSCGPGTGCNSPVTATDLRQGVPFWLRANPDFPQFNQALNASLHGDASLLAYIPLADIRESVVGPLLCSDFSAWPSSLSSFQTRRIKTFASWNSLNDPSVSIWQMLLMCTVWPFAAPEQTTLPTNLTLMWMTADFDLNLPTELTTFAWEQSPEATLVIRHGDDHTSLPTAAGDIGRAFLRTGVMPGATSNLNFTIIAPGGTRGPVPGAYDVPTGAVQGDVSSIENIV